MKLLALVAVVSLGACAPTYANQRRVSRALLVVSTAAVACDYGQTMPIAVAGWPDGAREGNPVMGSSPSPARLTAWNAGVIAANLGLYKLLPERYDWIVPLGLTLVQASVIQMNVLGGAPRPVCGLR